MLSQQRFPKIAAAVLAAGLIAILAIAAFSFALPSYPARSVRNVDQARQVVNEYISRLSPDLTVKEIMEFSNHYYAIVQEESTGINAFELLVDKTSGTIADEPGPNMMWNTKYGHMGRMNDPTATMPVTSQQASEYAQRWLNQNNPGAIVEESATFYGYYTIDVSKDGRIYGMLSVNGYTGEVWYHTWHGQFVTMEEYD